MTIKLYVVHFQYDQDGDFTASLPKCHSREMHIQNLYSHRSTVQLSKLYSCFWWMANG